MVLVKEECSFSLWFGKAPSQLHVEVGLSLAFLGSQASGNKR